MTLAGVVLLITATWAQTEVGDRMERDIQVAENVLGTLVKQQFEKNLLMPVEVQGSYRNGFGVTFTIPNFSNFPMNYLVMPRAPRSPKAPRVQIYGGQGDGYSYTFETNEDGDVVREELEGDKQEAEDNREENEHNMKEAERELKQAERAVRETENDMKNAEREMQRTATWSKSSNSSKTDSDDKDSKEYNKYLIEAAKTFLADYSTILSQLKPDERIIITNRNNEGGNRYWRFMGDEKRYFLSVETSGADIKQYQSGKLTKDQFINKVKVVESEVDSERSQDLELITTIFDRLYQPDLSKTFFTEEDSYYERLKDYGAIFYMNVYSSNQLDRGYFNMPTQNLEKVSEEERNEKVKELYPAFEKELKENILEYGRTVKSLKPEEVLVFNVRLTKCKTCGIPSTLEITTRASVLNDYMMGKLDKNAALAKLEVKKGAQQ